MLEDFLDIYYFSLLVITLPIGDYFSLSVIILANR